MKIILTAVHGVIDGMPTKPNPFTALEIAKKLGVKPSECLFLGDTNVDIFTAKNAGDVRSECLGIQNKK